MKLMKLMKKVLTFALLIIPFIINAQDVRQIGNGFTGRDAGRINAAIRQVNDLSAPPYAYLQTADSAIVVALDSAVWVNIANPDSSIYATESIVGITQAGDSLTILSTGHYQGVIWTKYKATASDSIQIAIFKNATIATPISTSVHTGTETVEKTIPFFLPSLVIGDDLTIKVVNIVSGDDVTVESIYWFLKRIDE